VAVAQAALGTSRAGTLPAVGISAGANRSTTGNTAPATAYTAQGVMAAFAGIVLASRITSGQPNTSQGFELEVISACVLGGVSLTGGVGSMAFVIAGVLIMGIVQNAMNLMNVATFYQYVARGLILLAAVLFDRWKRRKQ
jgi:L-arabinose transport system permease protein